MRFVSAIQRWATEIGGEAATVMDDRRRTWSQAADRAARLGTALREIGARRGSRIGIIAANSDRYLDIIHACWWIGAVPVPLNARWALAEHVEAANDAMIELLFVDQIATGLVASLRLACPALRQIVAVDLELADLPMLERLIAGHAPAEADSAADDDPAGIFYTGGATGRSKGVVHSGRSLWEAAMIGADGLRVPDPAVYLHAAPMFHLGGLMPGFMATALGGTHHFIDTFRPALVTKAIRTGGVTFTAMVPMMIAMLVEDADFSAGDYASLQLVQYGGGAIAASVRERLVALLPDVRFEQGYGQSEVGGGVSTLRHEVLAGFARGDVRRSSAGQIHPGIEIIVTDDQGQTVPSDIVGEFRIKSSGAMMGYLDRPAETAATIVDGWVRTGDAGYIDADGFVFVCDRLKDVVRPGGENVFSAEVESALQSHPAIAAVAVIAVPDDRWEERVHAVVTVRGGEVPTLTTLQAHCRDRIAGYKIPRSMEVIDAMPVSSAGKILKAALREPHWLGRERMWR